MLMSNNNEIFGRKQNNINYRYQPFKSPSDVLLIFCKSMERYIAISNSVVISYFVMSIFKLLLHIVK